MLTHDNLWSNVATLHRAWGFRPGDVLVHVLPLFHTHGLFVALNLMLMNGGRMIFLPKFEAETVIGLLPRATVLMGVPTYYTRLLASPRLTRDAAAGMRLFVSGSAPLLAVTHAEFEARTGHRILERYGMTETGMNASNPLDGERRPGTVGPALPGVELRVCDAEGRELPAGETGVLEVRGPNVFAGYWRMPEKTEEEMRPGGWFVTGDLARIGADGYVTIVGRAKDLIITGGLNVYPKEVEQAIDALPGVVEAAVIGVPHPDFGEAVVAVADRARRPGRRGGGAARASGRVQAAQARGGGRRAAAQRHGQGAEEPAARALRGAVRRAGVIPFPDEWSGVNGSSPTVLLAIWFPYQFHTVSIWRGSA